MNAPQPDTPVLVARDLRRTFHRETGELVAALDGVSLQVRAGELTALVGPDGAGKTTLLRLATGLLTADSGELIVLGVDVARDPQQVQSRVGYMPQRFGLYEDLTVAENLNLYADLHGVSIAQRRERYGRLLEMTALGPFVDRLAGKLSGGMKQKLGLACTLVRSPDLLLLDEPTVGVDPLSRRELWAIIRQLVDEQGLTVLLSTSYLDEAEHSAHAIVMHQGHVLAQGTPASIEARAAGHTFQLRPGAGQPARGLQARLLTQPGVIDAVPEGGTVRLVLADEDRSLQQLKSLAPAAEAQSVFPRFEDGFMMLLSARGEQRPAVETLPPPARQESGDEPMVEAHDLVRRFGSFTAVDHVSFQVKRGEVFGLLGPNGAGKTTTFRMLCGLLPASGGTLRVAGVDLRTARASARQRIGYVAQKFSLYGQLSVIENLAFFAGAYGLQGSHLRDRVNWALEQFELEPLKSLPSGQLPGGYKQRLAMAAALMHEPEILFLDEPTSGVDPLARREFWQRITALAEQGVTVIVTTHFMEEAEYCDRVAILDAGKILAQGTPAEIRAHARQPNATMEDAFIAIVETARGGASKDHSAAAGPLPLRAPPAWLPPKARRVWSLVVKESRQMIRDPSSIALGIVLPVVLILLFGYGLSLDVKDAPVAVVLEEPSPDAMAVAASFELSHYFDATLTTSFPHGERLMLAREVDAIVRSRENFDRRLMFNDADVQLLVHGTDANRARIIQTYTQGAIAAWGAREAAQGRSVTAGPVAMRERLWFNEANESRYFLVPGLIVLIMTLIGAFLTTLVMAREWERGTLEALFVTPVKAGEILLGKTIPNFVLGLIGLALCVVAARVLFHVPLRGSPWLLIAASMLYLLVALGIGMLVSVAVKSQFVASQITILITFLPAMMLSGFLFDLRNMPAAVRMITYILPARYFVAVLQTVFLAGNVPGVLVPNLIVLLAMAIVLQTAARLATQKKLALTATGPTAMIESLQRILALTLKELLAILKDPRGRFTLFVPPVMQCLVFGYAATYDLNRVPYAVWDQDCSFASHELLARLDGSHVFQRVANVNNPAQLRDVINNRQALVVLQIDQDFERRLQMGQVAEVQVVADGRNSNTAGTALGYLGTIVESFNGQWRGRHGLPGAALRLESRAWFNPNLESRWNMIPALIGTLTMLQTLLLTAMSVAREREAGTFDQLLVTPFRPVEIMAGKALPSVLVGTVQATTILLVAQLWFRIPFSGSFGTLYLGLGLFLSAAVGIGLLVSSVVATLQQALLFSFVLVMPFTLLSGLATPLSSMPLPLQYLTLANPLRYAIDIAHRVYLEGANSASLVGDFWPLALIALVTLSAASWMFRHRLG